MEADKATTLPRTRKETVVTAASSPKDTFKSRTADRIKKMPLIRRKKKKKDTLEVPTENGIGGLTDTSSIEGGASSEISGDLSGSTLSISTASASPAIQKKENLLQKSPRLARKQIKSLIKGGKNLFKSKNESAPIAVETSLDLHRTVPAVDNEIPESSVNADDQSSANPADSANDELDYDESKMANKITETKDDWSVIATCKRVKKLSVIEIPSRNSVFLDQEEDDEKMKNGSVVTTPEQEVVSEAGSSYPPSPTTDTPTSGDQSSMSFERKSPSTLKKEIMAITNRPSSENVYIMEKLRNRKISLQTRPSDKNDLLFKILVIGELGTGKTSIIKRYVHQFFSQHYRATIGVDFALKVLSWDNNTTIRLQLWDIAGQERFGNMTRVYYKEAVGAFIVFDVTRVGTFEAIVKWKQDLDSKVQLPDGETIPCVLLANKCDQPKEGIVNNNNKMEEFCREHQFVAWYETSAKENINVDEAANCLVSKIVQNDAKRQQEKETVNGGGVVAVDAEKKPYTKTSNCFC